jgi:hypothetical protein
MYLRICILFCLAAALGLPPAEGGLAVQSGILHLNGGSLQTDALEIAPGAILEGNGTLDVPSAVLSGLTAPFGNTSADTGTLLFSGALNFSGIYFCTVNGHTDLDLISATGAITGNAQVQVDKAPAAIPLDQVILSGDPASDYALFTAAQPVSYRLSTPAPGDLALTDLLGDTDLDDLPDWWEYTFYTNRIIALPGNDDDNDRSLNLQELGAGTDPRDPASVFAIVQVDTNGGHRVFWNSVDGKTYSIETTAAAIDGTFTLLTNGIAADPPVNSWTNPVPVDPAAFYRVTVTP